jgi:outer membrane protein assembly factor BamB
MRRFLAPSVLTALLFFMSLPVARGDDWAQWLGPRRNGLWSETGVLQKFPAEGPRIKWRAKVAGGYAGPAVADGRVFVADFVRLKGDAKSDPGTRNQLEGEERLVCLSEESGEELWVQKAAVTYGISYPAGPRAIPTVDGEHVYMLGAEGSLTCFAVKNGDIVWKRDLKAEYQAPTPMWGFCSHPLIDGDRLYVLAGGPGSAAVCLDKATGKEIWKALTAKDAGYCPPTMIDVAGRKELIIWTPETLNGLNPDDGAVRWSVPLEPSFGMSIVAPVQSGQRLFAAGVGDVGVMLDLSTGDQPTPMWKSSKTLGIGPVHSPVLSVGNVLYGVNNEGELTCLDIATGKRLWQTFDATTGTRRASSATAFLTRNEENGLFYIFSETGDLIIAKLTPEKYEEISRAHVIEPNHEAFGRTVVWSAPAFANRCAFIRNNAEIVCVDLSAN